MDHPFIVKLHYAFQTKSRLFLIVDLLPGVFLILLFRENFFIYFEKWKGLVKPLQLSMLLKFY